MRTSEFTEKFTADMATTDEVLMNVGGVSSRAKIKNFTDYQNKVVALTDAATIAIDSDSGYHFSVTLGGNRTLGAPTGTPVDGQQMIVRVRQDGTGTRTLAYNAIYRFGSTVTTPTLTTTINKTDYLYFRYNSTDTKWDCTNVVKGY